MAVLPWPAALAIQQIAAFAGNGECPIPTQEWALASAQLRGAETQRGFELCWARAKDPTLIIVASMAATYATLNTIAAQALILHLGGPRMMEINDLNRETLTGDEGLCDVTDRSMLLGKPVLDMVAHWLRCDAPAFCLLPNGLPMTCYRNVSDTSMTYDTIKYIICRKSLW